MLLFLVVIAVTVARQGATLLKKKCFRFFVESGTTYCFLLNACIRPFQELLLSNWLLSSQLQRVDLSYPPVHEGDEDMRCSFFV